MDVLLSHRVCIAPILKYTDRHFRYFMRLISHHVMLYTEMITTGALLYGDHHRYLSFNDEEHPVAIQLAGNDPDALSKCARLAAQYGYDEINLNVGCPSPRVQSGQFGVCLMQEPNLVAECVAAIKETDTLPVSIKTRIGVDHNDSYEALTSFLTKCERAGCQIFIIHARKAYLEKYSPKENRYLPPLQYNIVHQVKHDFPDLKIIINGGIRSIEDIQRELKCLDGVMIGQGIYSPYWLSVVDQLFFNDAHLISSRNAIIENYLPYIERNLQQDVPAVNLIRPLLGLFKGCEGAREWRKLLTEMIQTKEITRLKNFIRRIKKPA